MDEDLILLGMNIKKDPLTYRAEYLTQIKTFTSLINLPSVPIRQIKPMIFFIVKYSHVEPVEAVDTLVNALNVIQDYRTKRVVLNGLIIIRQKKLIESKDLLRLVIVHGNDLRYFLNSVQEFLDVYCYPVLKEWYNKGTERQKSFCYFLLLVLFSKIHDVSDREFQKSMRNAEECDIDNQEASCSNVDNQISSCSNIELSPKKIKSNNFQFSDEDSQNTSCSNEDSQEASCFNEENPNALCCDKDFSPKNNKSNNFQFADKDSQEASYSDLDFSPKNNNFELIDEDNELSDDEEAPKKINFARDEIRFSNTSNTVDLDELEQIIGEAFFISGRLSKICCLYFLNRTEVKFDISKIKRGVELGKRIYKDLHEIMDRDIKIMKLKIFTLFKNAFQIKKSILKLVVKMIDLENPDLKDLLDCLVKSIDKSETDEFIEMISEGFVFEGQQEDVVVLGINVLRELFSKFLFSPHCVEDDSEYEEFLGGMKEKILKVVESFQRNRSKPIHYAYKMLIKVVINHERVETPVSQIKRRTTKEEMNILRTKGREEIKRLRAEAKREEDQKKYKNKKKGRKQTTMAKYMMKPTKRKGLKKKQRCK